jgi:large subunit ribosomal protein L35
VATGRKLKVKSAASKRFFVSGTGKIRYHKTNKRHLMTSKSAKRTRSLKTGTLEKGQSDNIRKVLG